MEKKIEARRRALRTIALGSGAVVAGKSLPDTWTKPVVDSVILPAHAKTSELNSTESELVTCTGESASIKKSDSEAGIAIHFDGVSTASLIPIELSNRDPDTFIFVTISSNMSIGRGVNWSPDNAIVELDIVDGIYTRSSTRMVNGPVGDTYEVTFCVTTSGTGDTKTLTVVLVSMVKI